MVTSVPGFDVMYAGCPSRVVLQRIGDKWTSLVFQVLKDGPQRFSVIRDAVQGITPKVLTQTLRTLERDGLVSREVYQEIPPRVEYALTPLGRTLLEPLDAVRVWAEEHAAKILQAREDYDEAASPK
ncbi:helix-turn-helix transcriptional regulator [Arthrobacter sp. I2-34]|uniref:Helix-turn-helix transcriptional regulator n=1 Tax=Arthrobacter hankyongi TaxID=2904801 RepID=A0ABS9L4P8_9MICC|nr:helix-turn-helix domain-containing protein [Arthrobacter hankyongi]MCG2621449.1 helix-turn-helix transcriptional regulator [Arthrobacter hankyongi]